MEKGGKYRWKEEEMKGRKEGKRILKMKEERQKEKKGYTGKGKEIGKERRKERKMGTLMERNKKGEERRGETEEN